MMRRKQEIKNTAPNPVQRNVSGIKKSKQKNKFFVVLYDTTNRFTDNELIPYGKICLAKSAREASRKTLRIYWRFIDQTLKIDVYNISEDTYNLTGKLDIPIQKDMSYSETLKLINILKTQLTKTSLYYKAIRTTKKIIFLYKQTSDPNREVQN